MAKATEDEGISQDAHDSDASLDNIKTAGHSYLSFRTLSHRKRLSSRLAKVHFLADPSTCSLR